MNELEGFRSYRSPFDAGGHVDTTSKHWAWYYHREQYAKTGDLTQLEVMLSKVTADNPPFNTEPTADEYKREIREGYLALLPYGIILTAGLVFAGIFGGVASVAAVVTVLFVITAIAWVNH